MLQDSQVAVQFVDKLIAEKGLQDMDEEVRLQLRNDLLRLLEDKINREIVNSLSNEQLAQFEHLIDAKQLDKLEDFLNNCGVNVNGVVARAMTELQDSL